MIFKLKDYSKISSFIERDEDYDFNVFVLTKALINTQEEITRGNIFVFTNEQYNNSGDLLIINEYMGELYT